MNTEELELNFEECESHQGPLRGNDGWSLVKVVMPLLRLDANLPVFTKACSVEAKGHLIFSKKAQRHNHSSPLNQQVRCCCYCSISYLQT